ncbi:type II secretion system minor pseudopilin GspI [Pseudomonas mangrovi]|uniref:Type II secretion system protein I n=1 Tax=Pseudomonas mangrovi TaxID=2161748 RepID=A0A2T5P4P8_9PSED|nr:type II secretion system minor pseudopilin GspI [Pseudomonas mangrovi]PTU72708.1 type II secretion system protein GspI [Pseudomonas mangrovi]
MKRMRGFTLLEVLVALGIFAIVAASVLTASSRSLQNAARLEEKTMAMWIADNRLSEMQLLDPPPGDGRDQGEVDFAGRRWEWRSEVSATSEPAMRRVEVLVAPRVERGPRGDIEERSVARLSGFLSAPQ